MIKNLSEAFKAFTATASRKDAPESRTQPVNIGRTRNAWDESLFQGAVVLITGAGSGIGQSCALQFALHGCQKLFLVDLSCPKLEQTAALIKKASLQTQMALSEGDVSSEASVKNMIVHCVRVYGRLDIACNNAGIGSASARTSDISTKDYDRVCTVNERGTFLCETYEIKQMLRQEPLFGNQRGVIVNVSSIAGHCIIPTTAAYGASKHAVVAFTRCDALMYAQDSIRINCVSPGAVWTPMVSEAGLPQQFIDMGAAQAPMKRYVDSIEAADAVLFLASPQASAISGINLPVDCGTQLLRSI